ncbi:hypothetical protein [Solirubrobacter soli]|uniref:hypothetical protein n=1 Tax=Solirubrobacter soli TaxID=363832 RepID=UPI0012F7F5B4|nr:hypothetical protein [Solirubrobacter soli]
MAIALAACVVCVDYAWVAVAAELAVVALCLYAGLKVRGWRALWLAAAVLGGVFVGDVLWAVGFPPFDRDDLYEPLPMLFLAVPATPIFVALLAVGVAAGRRRRGAPPNVW